MPRSPAAASAAAFSVVTTVVLAVFLLGWRLVGTGLVRRAERRDSRRPA